MVNVTNGKPIRLLVDDEPFDLRYGELRSHERALDLRAGTLTRQVEWCSPAGQVVRIRTVRLVSFTHRAIAAIQYEVEPVEQAGEADPAVGARRQRGPTDAARPTPGSRQTWPLHWSRKSTIMREIRPCSFMSPSTVD